MSEIGRNEATESAGTPDPLETEYVAMVSNLAKPGADILATLTPEKCHLWHMNTGQSGESGELSDAIKRYVIYNKAIDLDNVIEELGDIEFYLEGIRQGLGITRERTLQANMTKLLKGKNARYATGAYSDVAAQQRADKAPSEIEPPMAAGAVGSEGQPGDANA